jgi:hypothetical protein
MRKNSIVVLVLVAGAALAATVFREEVASAAPALRDVFVINDATQPVPVQQVGTADVRIADAREPFEIRLDASLDNGTFSGTDGFTIPTGKRLIAEFIAVSALVPVGQTPLVYANADSGALGFVIPLEQVGQINPQGTQLGQYAGAMKILDFENAGEFYDVTLARQAANGGAVPGRASLSVFISGYLVPQP